MSGKHRRRSAAKFLTDNGHPIDHAGLEKLAGTKDGPAFEITSAPGIPMYSESDLRAWAESQKKSDIVVTEDHVD